MEVLRAEQIYNIREQKENKIEQYNRKLSCPGPEKFGNGQEISPLNIKIVPFFHNFIIP
jgi:hypothetical protein